MHQDGTNWTRVDFQSCKSHLLYVKCQTTWQLSLRMKEKAAHLSSCIAVSTFSLWPAEWRVSWVQHLEDDIFRRGFPAETLKAEVIVEGSCR